MADLKAINFTTGIGTHDSCVVLQPLEEFVERIRFLDIHWVPILRKILKRNTVTISLTMRVQSSTHSTISFPRNTFWSLSLDITLLICKVYTLLLFILIYLLPIRIKFVRLFYPLFKSIGNVMLGGWVTTGCTCFFGRSTSLRKRDIVKKCAKLRVNISI